MNTDIRLIVGDDNIMVHNINTNGVVIDGGQLIRYRREDEWDLERTFGTHNNNDYILYYIVL